MRTLLNQNQFTPSAHKGESLGEPRLSYKRLAHVITLHRTEIQIRFTLFEQAR